SILRLEDRELSIILCPSKLRPQRTMSWSMIPVPSESLYATLICMLNSANDGFYRFHLFPRIDKVKPITFTEKYPWLLQGERVNSLEELGKVAQRVPEGGT